MGKMVELTIRLEMPDKASKDDVRDYVITAIQNWKGSFSGFYDPMTQLDLNTIYVSRPVYWPKQKLIDNLKERTKTP